MPTTPAITLPLIRRLTMDEVAAHFGVNRRTVSKWVTEGKIGHLVLGGRRAAGVKGIRFTVEDVLAFEQGRRRAASSSAGAQAQQEAMWGRMEQLLRRIILEPAGESLCSEVEA